MSVLDNLSKLCDIFTPFQAAVATSLLIFYFIYLFLKNNELPPGPIGVPFFGYWPFLKADSCHIQLKQMAEKYGDVFSFRAVGKLFIHLGSIKSIKEAHITKTDCFAGRVAEYSVLSNVFHDGIGIINGEPWKILRKFFLTKFKEYGTNEIKDTGLIQDALNETVEELHKSRGQPVEITELVTSKCLFIIKRVLFNDEGISTEDIHKLIHEYSTVLGGFSGTSFLLFGNFSRFLVFPFMRSTWQMKSCQRRIHEILENVIKRHRNTFDEANVSNVVDCFIQERNERSKKGDPSAEYFTDESLGSSLSQFITDGVLTVGHFIGTFLLSLVEYPDEQDKVYNEIIDVVGHNRLPTMEDKPKLHYTNAFICEVMRLSDVFPLFPSLECSRDTEVQGFKIPKGSITLLNLYAAQRNPKTFEDPETFCPARYLPEAGKPRPDLPILFGVGKRSCIGEGFAMNQVFLFLTTIVKTFQLSLPEDGYSPSTILCSQEGLKIRAIPRTQSS